MLAILSPDSTVSPEIQHKPFSWKLKAVIVLWQIVLSVPCNENSPTKHELLRLEQYIYKVIFSPDFDMN